jgi:hypothetical protein
MKTTDEKIPKLLEENEHLKQSLQIALNRLHLANEKIQRLETEVRYLQSTKG